MLYPESASFLLSRWRNGHSAGCKGTRGVWHSPCKEETNMWIVRLALRRPYTFVVASLVLLLLTPFVLLRTPTDIFPSINIPVVSTVWKYDGLDAQEMERRFTYAEERALTTTVNDIEHVESTAYQGIGVVKAYFHEGVSVDAGVAQVTAICQTLLKQMPPGATPPLIIRYSA